MQLVIYNFDQLAWQIGPNGDNIYDDPSVSIAYAGFSRAVVYMRHHLSYTSFRDLNRDHRMAIDLLALHSMTLKSSRNCLTHTFTVRRRWYRGRAHPLASYDVIIEANKYRLSPPIYAGWWMGIAWSAIKKNGRRHPVSVMAARRQPFPIWKFVDGPLALRRARGKRRD